MAEPSNKPNRNNQSKEDLRKETEAEMQRRLDDTRKTLDRYVEDEVERRISKWTKSVTWIGGLSVSLIATIVAATLLFQGDDYFKKLVSRKVEEAASPAVVAEITNRLSAIVRQAEARSKEIDQNWLQSIKSAASTSKLAHDLEIEFTNAISLLNTNRQEFLDRINFLNATNNVIAITELPTLLTNETFPGSLAYDGRTIELSHFPISNSVQITITDKNQTAPTEEQANFANSVFGSFTIYGKQIKGKYIDGDGRRDRAATNWVVRVFYMRMPLPKFINP